MAYHDPNEVFVVCPFCQSSVRVPVGDDSLEFPQFQQVTAYMREIGWTVLSKGFRIDCLCPDCASLLDGSEGEEYDQ